MYKILFATDGSKHSLQAAGETMRLAKALDAKVAIISVAQNVPPFKGHEGLSFEQMEEYANKVNDAFLKDTKKILLDTENMFQNNNIPSETILRQGHPAEVICQVAEERDFSLIVMGSSGKGAIKGLLLGSVSNRVTQCAKANVYIVK